MAVTMLISQIAASKGNTLIVDMLLAVGGASVQQNEPVKGYTALHWAARGGWLGTCKTLVIQSVSTILVEFWEALCESSGCRCPKNLRAPDCSQHSGCIR